MHARAVLLIIWFHSNLSTRIHVRVHRIRVFLHIVAVYVCIWVNIFKRAAATSMWLVCFCSLLLYVLPFGKCIYRKPTITAKTKLTNTFYILFRFSCTAIQSNQVKQKYRIEFIPYFLLFFCVWIECSLLLKCPLVPVEFSVHYSFFHFGFSLSLSFWHHLDRVPIKFAYFFVNSAH